MVIKEDEHSVLSGKESVIGEEQLSSISDLPRVKALINSQLGLSEAALQECRIAVAEAIANALTHGQRDGVPYCRVVVGLNQGAVHITIEDRGAGFDWRGLHTSLPGPEEEHGRGIHLIREMMDQVSIRSTPQGTRIEMIKLQQVAPK